MGNEKENYVIMIENEFWYISAFYWAATVCTLTVQHHKPWDSKFQMQHRFDEFLSL